MQRYAWQDAELLLMCNTLAPPDLQWHEPRLDKDSEVHEEATMKVSQSASSSMRDPSQTRLLLDTNVWRYLIDLNALETVYRAAKGANGVILACPAVLYEMLRLEDASLRQLLVKAICRSRWVRMMPEAFEESEEFKAEIGRLHPEWLLLDPDRATFNRLYNDWNGPRGVWWRARVDPSLASRVLRAAEENDLDRGRNESRDFRAQIGAITTFENVTLDRWTSTFPLNPPGWDGNPVETWRAETMRFYFTALLVSNRMQSPATREWLEPWINLTSIRNNLPSFARFFLYETDASQLQRNWLRWAFRTLQATRKTSPGTPVDNQIGSYLVDADIIVTADKIFVSIIQRIAVEAVVPIAKPLLVSVDNCVQKLIETLTEQSQTYMLRFDLLALRHWVRTSLWNWTTLTAHAHRHERACADGWQYAVYAAIAYIRAAASRAGVPVRQACQDLDERLGHPAP